MEFEEINQRLYTSDQFNKIKVAADPMANKNNSAKINTDLYSMYM